MNVKEKLVELLTDLYGCDPAYYDVDACAIAQHLVDHAVAFQEWISVDDRLPEKDGAYLTVINCFGYHSYIDVHSFAKDGESVDEYNLAGEKDVWYFYDSEYGYVPSDSVTHWMPLPALPKGE